MQDVHRSANDIASSASQYSVLMPPKGHPHHSQAALVFVLHGHLPYARRQGQWPHGEEWIHEAASTTYIPLLIALTDMAERGVPFRLTIGLTPILMEQLSDAAVIANLETYLLDRLRRAESDRIRFAHEGFAREARVAMMYAEHFDRALEAFQTRFNRNIVAGFAALQRSGHVELMVSAATHGYLPLLGRASSIAAQLQIGIDTYERHVGTKPTSIWLPECAYRPAQGGLPGIETFLAAQGLNLFFTEAESLEEAPLAGGDAGRPTTFRPYHIASSRVSVVGRNARVREQVWSRYEGYPGDRDYREFHRKDAESGLWYWRITGEGVDLGEKDLYEPAWAATKVEAHAHHFVSVVEDEAAKWGATSAITGLISAAYDAELFGHWWFEGVQWLARVLELAASGNHPTITTATAGGYVSTYPATEAINLPPSSWGRYRTDYTWNNAKTAWMWPVVHERERRMEMLVARYPRARGSLRVTLAQASRELLLLESSDWPFLVTTGQADEYATRRFNAHVKRFDRLTILLDAGTANTSAGKHLRTRIEQLDNPFPRLDYHVFQDRGPANASLGPISPGSSSPEIRSTSAISDQTSADTPIDSGWGSDYLWHSSVAQRSNEQ